MRFGSHHVETAVYIYIYIYVYYILYKVCGDLPDVRLLPRRAAGPSGPRAVPVRILHSRTWRGSREPSRVYLQKNPAPE